VLLLPKTKSEESYAHQIGNDDDQIERMNAHELSAAPF
jgi:hypothetical protein